jgi:hypothetical protein
MIREGLGKMSESHGESAWVAVNTPKLRIVLELCKCLFAGGRYGREDV